MKFPFVLFALCCLTACNVLSGNHRSAGQKAKTDLPGHVKDAEPIVVTEHNRPYLSASGFEPMWTLNLFMAQDGSFPASFSTVTEHIAGNLHQLSDSTFEGIVKDAKKEKLLKVSITNKPCDREHGTKDPHRITINYNNITFSGCGRKP